MSVRVVLSCQIYAVVRLSYLINIYFKIVAVEVHRKLGVTSNIKNKSIDMEYFII